MDSRDIAPARIEDQDGPVIWAGGATVGPVRYVPTRQRTSVRPRSAGAHAHPAFPPLERPLSGWEIAGAMLAGLLVIVAVGYLLGGLAWLCGPGCAP